MDLFKPVELVPVAKWRWHLYEVKFWRREPQDGDHPLKTQKCVATASHIDGLVNEQAGLIGACTWVSWDLIKEDVPRPSTIGQVYGMPLSESGWSAGERYEQGRS